MGLFCRIAKTTLKIKKQQEQVIEKINKKLKTKKRITN